MGFSPTILRSERIREDCPGAGLSIKAGQCDGQRGEQNSQSKPPGAGQLGSTRESPLGSADPWWIFPQPWKSFKALNSFLPCPSPVSSEACGLCVVLNSKGKQCQALLSVQSSKMWQVTGCHRCPEGWQGCPLHPDCSRGFNFFW